MRRGTGITSDSEPSANKAHWSVRLPGTSPARAFARVFTAVFLFIFLSSALVTFMLPETYRANARVKAQGAAALERFQSAELLKEVSQQLNLAQAFAARYGEKRPLTEKQTEDLLRRSVQVQRLADTGLVEIRVYSASPGECALLANAIAETGAKQVAEGSPRIVDRAVPPLRPSRPNKPLNLALGALIGMFLGTMAGGLGAKLAVGFDGRSQVVP